MSPTLTDDVSSGFTWMNWKVRLFSFRPGSHQKPPDASNL